MAILQMQSIEVDLLILQQRHPPRDARFPVRAVDDGDIDMSQAVLVPSVKCYRSGRQDPSLDVIEGGGQGGPRTRHQVFSLEHHRRLLASKITIDPGFEVQLPVGTQSVESPANRTA